MLGLGVTTIKLNSSIPYFHEKGAERPRELNPAMNSHCTIIELQQGSREWREWRHKGIGSSDASVIMGENKYRSVTQLLREKCGPCPDCPANFAMERGIKLEPEAREQYCARTKRTVGAACLQSTRYEWLRASLDGFASTHDAVVEIKCGESAYRGAWRYRCVPSWYRGQLQHILAVTGFDCVDFFCYAPNCEGILIVERRNNDYIKRLLEREFSFWNEVQSNLQQIEASLKP